MRLWEPSRCCCFNLRTGCLIIAGIHLVYGCLSLIWLMRNLAVTDIEAAGREICKDLKDYNNCEDNIRRMSIGFSVTSLITNVLQVTFSSLLIHGVLKKKTRYFIPLMIMYLVQIVIVLLLSLVAIGFCIFLGVKVISYLLVVVCGLAIFLKTYFLLVIRTYYLQVKQDKGKIHVSLNEEGSPPPSYHDCNMSTDY